MTIQQLVGVTVESKPYSAPVTSLGTASNKSSKVVVMGLLGLALGASLGFIGFGDYGELFKMFTLADARLFLTFGGAVAVTAIGLRFFVKTEVPRPPVTLAVPMGAALFGAGWAIAGACPGVALVQIGEGSAPALITFAGILLGVRIYDAVETKRAASSAPKV